MIGYNHLGRNGRLGNQMFQYASLRGIASNLGYEFIIPNSDFDDEWNTHQLFEIFKLPNLKNKGFVENKYVQEKQYNFDQELFDQCPDNVSLLGYFQTEKYFINIEDSIKQDFEFQDEILKNSKEVMSEMENPISLHVRRTDYVQKSQDHPPCTMDYYYEALSNFDKDRQVIIFSDDINWCKKQDIFKPDRFLISETGSNAYDLCLMSLCSDYIIANSSFSWWGAWLSQNKNPKVIAPNRWFGTTGYTASHNTEDIIPDRWIKI
jgi:hypothetical protein